MKRSLALVALILMLALPVMAAEVPPTIPHPGINGENGYVIGLTNLDTRTLLWRAPYLYETPYADLSGWLAGDRVGYGCAYGFLQHNGHIIGRFTARAIPDAADYMRVNDTYMVEGGRYYDGSLTPPGTVQVPDFECPEVTESYAPSTADERPKVVFWDGDEPIEIRDYLTIDPAPGVTFDLVAEIHEPFYTHSSKSGDVLVNSRISVVAMENGIPEIVFYYDALGTGSMFAPEDEPTEPDCNAIISMSQGAQVYSGSQAGASDPDPSPLEVSTGEEWMLLFKGGAFLKQWKSQLTWNSIDERHRCGTDAEIDRVLFIFDPNGSAAPFTNDLAVVEGIMANRYPNAVVEVALLVGGEGHVTCTIVQLGQLRTVTASVTHANSIGQMTMPNAGPDLDIPCAGYSDQKGHLNDFGAGIANATVGAFYSGG